MSKIAVIVTNDVEDIEYTSPVDALKNAGHEVTVIENKAGNKIKGKHGVDITADQSIADVTPADFDGLLIPGGFSPDQLRALTDLSTLSKHFSLQTNQLSRFATVLNCSSKQASPRVAR